jgi:RNA polymerase sigma factor (sigma-70 family)
MQTAFPSALRNPLTAIRPSNPEHGWPHRPSPSSPFRSIHRSIERVPRIPGSGPIFFDTCIMAEGLPSTSLTLLSRLQNPGDPGEWQISWKRFHQIYHGPLLTIAASLYREHTGGAIPPQPFLEDTVSQVVVDFLTKERFDPSRGRLRHYLRMLTNARVVDGLRKEKPLNHRPLSESKSGGPLEIPAETNDERFVFQQALLVSMIEDLKERIPMRSFEIFEMVKLKQTPPSEVARHLGVHRRVVDNTVYKVMQQLREIASRPEYREESLP